MKTAATAVKSNSVVSVKRKQAPFFNAVVQPRLTIGPVDDPYEREADAVADKVMRMGNGQAVQSHIAPVVVQKKCAACEEEKLQKKEDEHEESPDIRRDGLDGTVQKKCAACEKEKEGMVQAKPVVSGTVMRKCDVCEKEERVMKKANGTVASVAGPSVYEAINGPGIKMELGTRRFMEERFATDFGQVQIHNDKAAHRSSADIRALAYTHGHHIVFGSGQYQPNTREGRQLLAHELTHVVQQTGSLKRKEAEAEIDTPPKTTSVCDQYAPPPLSSKAGEQVSPGEAGIASQPVQSPATPEPAKAVTPPVATTDTPTKQESPVEEKPLKPDQVIAAGDPAFGKFIKGTGRITKSQKAHDPAAKKAEEAKDTAKKEDKGAIKSGAHLMTVEEKASKEKEKEFDPKEFKDAIRNRIKIDFPNSKEEQEKFEREGSLQKVNNQVLPEVKKGQQQFVAPAQEISQNPKEADENQKKAFFKIDSQEPVPENPGKQPAVRNISDATPKALPPEELKMEEAKDADSLDKLMDENKISSNQLAESEEPKFIDALADKQTAQKELCKVPEQLKSAEDLQSGQDIAATGKLANHSVGSMHGKRAGQLKDVQGQKDDLKSKDEILLEEYYTKIEGIFKDTKECVACILNDLEKEVDTLFREAVNKSYEEFKSKVKDDLSNYYGSSFLIFTWGNDEETEDFYKKLMNQDVDQEIAELKERSKALDSNDPEQKRIDSVILYLQSKRKKLNIERIFENNKDIFINSLDAALDDIAKKVADGLNSAKDKIASGRKRIDEENEACPKNIREKTDEKTKEIQSKFSDLEQSISDKETDLVLNISKQYNDSVGKLKATFEEIREEASLKWWQKAWKKIKEVATIIYNLGELLVNVLVKAVSVIGDIIAHPIRFVGHLIDGIGEGFRNFKKRLGQHLEEVIFDLIIGTVPPGITLPKEWNLKGIFGFALEVIGLSKQNIRELAIASLGEPLVVELEKAFDLFIIFKNEGFAGLWEYVKEKIGDLKNQIIDEVIKFFKESVLEAAVEFLLSILTPVSGFIKACKTIINIVMFFLKNLEKLARFIDSILDAMIDIAAGRITQVAIKVENALRDAMVIGIKFLASLVGINLDRIQEKVSRVINAIRSPVNRAITWLLDKAIAFAEKTGLLKLYKKGQEKLAAGKEWAGGKIKSAAATVAGWLGFKKTFTIKNGEAHEIYFEKNAPDAAITVASRTPMHLSVIIADKKWQGNAIPAEGINTLKAQSKKIDANRKEMTKERGELISKCFEVIVSVLNEVGDVELPETHIKTNRQVNEGKSLMGQELWVEPLSLKPGGLTGSQPTVGSELGDELKLKYPGYIVEGHLLNHNLHGPGYERWNLTPITKKTNGDMERQAERFGKTEVLAKGKVLSYHVKVVYPKSKGAKKQNTMASEIDLNIYEMKYNKGAKKWEKNDKPDLEPVSVPIINDTASLSKAKGKSS